MILVGGAGNQIHRLHHMGVAADEHIHTQIADLLSHLLLDIICKKLVFCAPVQVNDCRLCAVSLHFLQSGTQFGIEGIQLTVVKGVNQCSIRNIHRCIEVQRNITATSMVSPSIANHTNVNAIEILHCVSLLIIGIHNPQRYQASVTNDLNSAVHTYGSGIITVVVGIQQNIESCVFCAVHNAIRAVKMGISMIWIAIIIAAKGSLQIGHRQIRIHGVLGQVAEDGLKIVAAAFVAGVNNRHVHQQVAGGDDGGRGHHVLRGGQGGFRRLRLRRRRAHSRQCGLGGAGLDLHPLVGDVQTQLDHQGCAGNHQQHQNDQKNNQAGMSAGGLVGVGHRLSLLI